MNTKVAMGIVVLLIMLFCLNVAQGGVRRDNTMQNNIAASKSELACDLLSEKEAVELAGAPLGEVLKTESQPEAVNGYDHKSSCGYFPKGYSFANAETPPELGVQVTLHAMKTAAEVRRLYENTLDINQSMKSEPGSPFAEDKISVLKGMGEAAFVVERKIGDAPYNMALIFLLKGNVVMQVQAWKKAAAVADLAKKSANVALAKLP